MSAEQPPQTQVVVQQSGVTQTELEAFKQVVDEKLSSLRAWGVAAFLGGQALAGLVGAVVKRQEAVETVSAALRHLPF